MIVQIDSREKNNLHILNYFAKQCVDCICSKMYVGDYCKYSKPLLVIERKASWLEFAGNCGKNHARFKAELERLSAVGGSMVILIEEITPVEKWSHKRSQMSGTVMKKIIDRWKEEYKLELVQCTKNESGKKILEILGGKN